MDRILPKILATITGHARYKVEVQWCKNNWTVNAFRLYELIFWRRFGIRAESSCTWYKENGVMVAHLKCSSWESVIANFETLIRQKLSGLEPRLVRVPVFFPEFAFSGGYARGSKPIFLFAIAFDNSSLLAISGVGASPYTAAYTATGSNVSGHMGAFQVDPGSITAVSYGTSNGTLKNDQLDPLDGNVHHTKQWFIGACPTGSNNASFTWTGGDSLLNYSAIATYSGCSATVDNNSQSTTQSATDNTNSITPVVSNCWWVSYCSRSTINLSAGTGSTQRAVAGNGTGTGTYDSNATISGATTFHITASGSTGWCGIQTITLAPFGAVATVKPYKSNLLTMGVG